MLNLLFVLSEDSTLIEAMYLGLNEYYDQSFALINQVLSKNPTSIKAYLLKAIILDYRMDDYGNNIGEDEFFECIDKVIKFSSSLLQSENRAEGYFFIGSAYALRAFRYGKKGIYAPILSDIINGIDYLNKALEINKELYDAYLLLGLYNYASDQFPSFVKFILRTGDTKKRKKLGIEQLEIASEKSRYVKDLTKYALLEIYYRERMYNKAYEIGKELVQKYNHSRNIRWIYGKSLRALGKWEEARIIYEELLYLILDTRDFDKYQIVLSSYYTALSYYTLGKYEEAYQFLNFAYVVILENLNVKELLKLKPRVENLMKNVERYKG
ncbi:MAG: hypothetical protein RQ990_01720 [Candidatus Hydrothermia bacterium]|jgi:tetratricopeptide (TPR) repeat protein|nr:hypothetical protein [Candidatus Hydrothermia bacterium]